MVAESNHEIIAFADFKPSLPDRRWNLQALGASTGVYDPSPVWEEVLSAGVRQAGMNGVKRLYAQATAGTTAHIALRGAGFAPYSTETIYVADSPRTLGAEVSMREQEPADTWAIHQLYNASVPRDVLYAEALTSHAWDIANSRRLGAQHISGWLTEDHSGVSAYVRVLSDAGSHGIEVTFPPNAVKQGAALLDAVLRKLRLEKRINRVYISIRGYQQEIEPTLVRLGFAPGLTQDLLSALYGSSNPCCDDGGVTSAHRAWRSRAEPGTFNLDREPHQGKVRMSRIAPYGWMLWPVWSQRRSID